MGGVYKLNYFYLSLILFLNCHRMQYIPIIYYDLYSPALFTPTDSNPINTSTISYLEELNYLSVLGRYGGEVRGIALCRV